MEKEKNKKLFKDKPLSKISLSEFEKPGSDYFTNLRRFCISLGLVNPGESRVAIIYILDLLLKLRLKEKDGADSYAIMKYLYSKNIKIVYANVLRDLRKLVSLGIVEKVDRKYRIKENMKLTEIIDEFIKPYLIDRILKKIYLYAESIDNDFNKKKLI